MNSESLGKRGEIMSMDASPKSAAPKRATCTALRKDGEPCQSFAVERGLCVTHAGRGFTTATAREAQAKRTAAAQRRALARNESMKDKLARKLEAESDVVLARLFQIISSGTDSDARATIMDVLNRVYGKPTERLEVEERSGDVADLSLNELLAERDRIMQASSSDGVVGPSGE